MNDVKKQHISYVLPVHNEAESIEAFHEELTKTLFKSGLNVTFDFIYINDGSHDNSLELLKKIVQTTDNSVRVLNFSRNFGHQAAVSAGLDVARGDAVIIMDTDLQDPPEVSIELAKEWLKGDAEIVYAQRRSRQDTFFKRFTANIFYRVLEKLSTITIPRNTGDFRLIDKRVVDEIKKLPEYNRFLRGMMSYVGFRQKAVLFDRHERFGGESGYPLSKMINFAIDGIVGFSIRPLRYITYVGFVVFSLTVIGIAYILLRKLVAPDLVVSGFAFTTISVLFIGGLQIMMLGIIGEYVGRVYSEVQKRPLYIVKETIDNKK